MEEPGTVRRVLQMRLSVEAEDYEDAVAFYRDVLGAPEELFVAGEGGEKVTILDVGRATLELCNPAQSAMISSLNSRLSAPAGLQITLFEEDAGTE
jgi:catechol 2,3-dioxygenase-like lactoylglutathione lyase family enzyme